ncbi:RYR3 protein, partial [Nyctiprogne leucopyga]|nr:RYR3 protein [Nyctiprogne leucopyga]
TLKELISQTMVRWSQEDQIQDPELVRIMYTLLRRQYDSIGELLQALRKAYTISAASVKDTINLLAALGQIRSLLSVRMGKEEELLMINGLGYGINIILFLSLCKAFCHIRRPIVSWGVLGRVLPAGLQSCYEITQQGLLTINLCTVSTDVRYCSGEILQNKPLGREVYRQRSVASEFPHVSLCQVVTYLAGCGLQSCPVLLAKGYPDIGWNPIEGERYLSFLRFAVFVN